MLLCRKEKQIPKDVAPNYSLKPPTATSHLPSLMLAQLRILHRYQQTAVNLTTTLRASLVSRPDGLTAD